MPLAVPAAPFGLARAALEATPESSGEPRLDAPTRAWDALHQSQPALSADGQRLLLNISWSPCCAENGTVEVEPRQGREGWANAKRTQRWLLAEADPNGREKMRLAACQRVMTNFVQELQRGEYHALSSLLGVTYLLQELELRYGERGLQLEDESTLVLLWREQEVGRMALPSFSKQGSCCGEEDPRKTCKLPGSIQGIWVDEPTGLLVIQVGNNGGPDWCESRPVFLVRPWPVG